MPYMPPTVGQLALPPAMFPLPALSGSPSSALAVAPLELVRFLMRLHITSKGGPLSDARKDDALAAAHDLCQLIAHSLGANSRQLQPPSWTFSKGELFFRDPQGFSPAILCNNLVIHMWSSGAHYGNQKSTWIIGACR